MNRPLLIAIGVLLFAVSAIPQQTAPSDDLDIIPGFKLRTTGGLDIGPIYAEVVQFDPDWTETEQHDIFHPEKSAPTTQPGLFTLTGKFPLKSNSFALSERISPIENGIDYSATMSADKDLITTNELSLALSLPVANFGGKQITIDHQPLDLPLAPAAKGEAHLFDKEDVTEIDLPTTSGTLVITGDFDILVQDDREWGDQRYGLRIHFTPADGDIKQSTIDLKMKWKPAGG
jgi:hypothetical protein